MQFRHTPSKNDARKSGARLTGTLLFQDSEQIVLQTDGHEIAYPTEDVLSIDEVVVDEALVETQFDRAQHLRNTGKPKRAVALAEDLLRFDFSDEVNRRAHQFVAETYLQSGDLDQFEASAVRALNAGASFEISLIQNGVGETKLPGWLERIPGVKPFVYLWDLVRAEYQRVSSKDWQNENLPPHVRRAVANTGLPQALLDLSVPKKYQRLFVETVRGEQARALKTIWRPGPYPVTLTLSRCGLSVRPQYDARSLLNPTPCASLTSVEVTGNGLVLLLRNRYGETESFEFVGDATTPPNFLTAVRLAIRRHAADLERKERLRAQQIAGDVTLRVESGISHRPPAYPPPITSFGPDVSNGTVQVGDVLMEGRNHQALHLEKRANPAAVTLADLRRRAQELVAEALETSYRHAVRQAVLRGELIGESTRR